MALTSDSPGRGAAAIASAAARYRRSGADLPFGDPCGYHGTALEGYFWRITEPRSGTVIIVMASVNRDADGVPWGTAAVAAHPGVPVRVALATSAIGRHRGAGITIADGERSLLRADAGGLRVALPDGTRIDATIDDGVPWPRRALGGIGIGHLVPGLSQYWHPYLLGGRARGEAVLDGRTIALDGAVAYAEKNWSPSGFPSEWWWGQAQGFARDDVCVAFAGGHTALGPLTMRASALVVRLGDEVIAAAQPLQSIRTRLADGRWTVSARVGRYTIEIDGQSAGSVPHRLPVPIPTERRHAPEVAVQHLSASLALTVRSGRRIVFRGESALAGLERGGAGVRD